ncbi:hypothetical protein C5167_042195 [Papaver somniferum]|uniref:WAT1-related protein n=1 Tax=Papaver somniferum TaxID=3469 RepID=A0A4Y7L5R6_PAPSO|nr:hypothetical protein C5167_042195 [Papaver somniferum]
MIRMQESWGKLLVGYFKQRIVQPGTEIYSSHHCSRELVICFQTEELQFKSTTGCLKIAGTMLSVGGSLVLSFYSGFQIFVNKSSVDWRSLRSSGTTPEPNSVGPVLIALSCLSRFSWFQLQGRFYKDFPFRYTSTAVICLLSSIQCAIVGAGTKHTIRGLVGSAIAFLVKNFFITKKGPVFVSIFNPISLIFIQIFGWAFC